MEKARRYNKGKLRYNLIPENALKALADVYTRGAHKYTLYKDKEGNIKKGSEIPLEEVGNYEVVEDGSGNWRKGLPWMQTLESSQRHIEQFKAGEDFDSELGTYHIANAAWGLFSILEYYKIHPQGDDRLHSYLDTPKIGLDIDEVLCDWVGPWTKYWGIERPKTWFFDRDIMAKFKQMEEEKSLNSFYLDLPALISPCDIPFEPHCYVTSRPVDTEITEQWLDKKGFSARPVYTVPTGSSKVDIIKQSGIDIFVDDRFDNFVELNKAGICTYLYDAPHNQRYNVGYKRIKNLSELLTR